MSWEFVLLDKADDGVATLTLNRPEKYNAFGGTMRQQILAAVEDACADPAVRVLVLTGAGDKAFCAGGDVDEFVAGTAKALGDHATSERPAMSRIVLALNRVEKPVIAAVNGVAAGGGCNLALACDIRIVSEHARFGQVFTRRGAHPDWGGIYFLPRLVGYAKAAELIFSGEIIDAATALELGIANRVVPHAELLPTTYAMARQMARNAPIPLALAKRGLQGMAQMTLEQALDYEHYALGVVMHSEDFQEGFRAFLDKREPRFQGR